MTHVSSTASASPDWHDRPPRRSRTPRPWHAAAAAMLGLALLAGCSSSAQPAAPASNGTASSPATAPASAAGTAESSSSSSTMQQTTVIHISSFNYSAPGSVAPGSAVSVMNMDRVNHTVTADNAAAFDVQAPAGKTVTFTAPTTPGTYPFHCTYHSNMHGVLVVK